MAIHVWLLPWFGLFAGLLALGVGGAGSGFRLRQSGAPPPVYWLTWAVVSLAAIGACLRLGKIAQIDFIAGRGALLGLLIAVLVVEFCRQPVGPWESPPEMLEGAAIYRAASLVGLLTATAAAAQLWLTHGEISGLFALQLGLALGILCLGAAPSVFGNGTPTSTDLSPLSENGHGARPQRDGAFDAATGYRSVLCLLFAISLTSAVQIGFTRAHELKAIFWPDGPLLIAGALCIGLLGTAALSRALGINSLAACAPTVLAAALAAKGLMALPFTQGLPHTWTLAGVLIAGAVVFGLMVAALRLQPDADPGGAGSLVGFMMITLVCILAFAALSGYGLACAVLGFWFVAAGSLLGRSFVKQEEITAPAYALGFASMLLLHRLLLLQVGSRIRDSGPGDTLDLFSIGLGLLIPLVISAWILPENGRTRLTGWASILEWLLALAAPPILLEYMVGPRAVAGVLLGITLSMWAAGVFQGDRRRFTPIAISGAAASLVLLEFLPWLRTLDAPTIHRQLLLIAVCSGLLWVRMMMGRSVKCEV